MSEEPVIGGRAPIAIEVKAGEEYWWCRCGRSSSQPFCDGSHQDTGFEPIAYIAPETRRVLFCTCKRSQTAPLCDGSHNKLPASAT
jgi:CDGSH iron-sulfur domain-containing protein 3